MDDKTFVEEYGMTRDEVLQHADAGTLVHAGVKGMKWGKRKARPTGSRRERSIARGNKLIGKSGGNTSSAALSLTGKAVVSQILLGGANIAASQMAVKNAGTNKGIAYSLATFASSAASWGVLIKDIRSAVDINAANKARQNG